MLTKLINFLAISLFSIHLTFAGDWDELTPEVDAEIETIFSGNTLSENRKDYWLDKVEKYHAKFVKKYNIEETKTMSHIADDDVVLDHYIFNIKMSVIHPELLGGWPFGHEQVNRVNRILRERISEESSPVELSAAVLSAIRSNDIDFARSTYRKLLNKDKEWANYVSYYAFSTLGSMYSDGAEIKYTQEIRE